LTQSNKKYLTKLYLRTIKIWQFAASEINPHPDRQESPDVYDYRFYCYCHIRVLLKVDDNVIHILIQNNNFLQIAAQF
jgi:hypothetical protein